MIFNSPIAPSIGRVVLFRGTVDQMGRAAGEHVPAMITHVHSLNCVNLMVMRDGHGEGPVGVTSVQYAEAEEGEGPTTFGWWWMPYQKQRDAERAADAPAA